MPERYVQSILKYLAQRDYRPTKPRRLARQMGIAEADYGTFREAVKQLRESGRVVLGERDSLMLPSIGNRVVGFYRANPKGFGFVVPETPNAHGDLYIPPEAGGGAMSGDIVVAKVKKRGKRDGRTMYAGKIVEIVQRGQSRFVGTLEKADATWFVLPDGAKMATPIVVRDVPQDLASAGEKVVCEIVTYPQPGQLPVGVIVETLGQKGDTVVETLSVIRSHGLADVFSEAVLAEARQVTKAFDGSKTDGREDLSDLTVITIDPADARDYDDAISLTDAEDGRVTLGVHIADVSHFVVEGSELDAEARRRTTSAYFPQKVVPMLPEILSNGVCSLQQGQPRYAKSAFLTYDADANIVARRFAETVIRSTRRLTYGQAQNICDGKTEGHDRRVVKLVTALEQLARRIEARRRKAGMLHLDLPEVKLVFDKKRRLVDAVPADGAYSHTMIEMFMVEANDAVAELLNRLDRPCLRRIHPAPDTDRAKQLSMFIRACGHRLPAAMTRLDMQQLLESVRGKPESYAVNLALLKTFQQAEYSPMRIGHFALASDHYCHFTSPIRRYPDLTVHRLLAEHCRGTIDSRPPEDLGELTTLGEHCTAGEKRAEAAENEVREVLVLQLLAGKVGEKFQGVITGVTNFGLFVQSPRYLVDGLVRLEELGDDWWEVSARYGQVKGERTGRVYRIGDLMDVQIAGVDVARRQLNLVPAKKSKTSRPSGKGRSKSTRAKRKKDR